MLTRSALGYVVNYFNAFHGHPNTSIAHLWSLGVEEQFYLLWPALFLLLARRGLPTLRASLIAIVVGSVGWKVVLHYGLGVGQAYLYNAFDARFDNLAIGCLLAMLVRDPRSATVAGRLGSRAWMPLVTVALMMQLERLPGLPRHLFGFTLYSVLVAVLLVQILTLHATFFWRWLDSPPARLLGTLSYPIYLYHIWGLGLGQWLTMMPHLGKFVAGAIFAVVGALGSYYIVERPFLRLKRRFTPDRTSRVAQESHVGTGYPVEVAHVG